MKINYNAPTVRNHRFIWYERYYVDGQRDLDQRLASRYISTSKHSVEREDNDTLSTR